MSRKKSIKDKKICERIKELRLKLSLTGNKFANNIGISQGYLSDIENGKSLPNETLIFALSYIYNINDEWLFTGEGEITHKPENKEIPIKADEGVAEDTLIYNDIGQTKDKLIQTQDELISQMKKRITEMEEKIKLNEECKNKIREEDEEIQRGKILKQRAM